MSFSGTKRTTQIATFGLAAATAAIYFWWRGFSQRRFKAIEELESVSVGSSSGSPKGAAVAAAAANSKAKATEAAKAKPKAEGGMRGWFGSKATPKPSIDGILLDWKLSPGEILALCDEVIAEMESVDDTVAAVPLSSATYANTFGRIVSMDRELDPKQSYITFPKNVSTDKATRDACVEASNKLSAFGVKSNMRKDVYRVLKHVADQHIVNEEDGAGAGASGAGGASEGSGGYFASMASNELLDDEQRRFMEKTVLEYEHNGVHLEEGVFKQVEELKTKVTELETAFSTNINQDKSEVHVRPEALAGCGADFVESLEPAEGKGVTGKGLVTLTMSYPHYFTVQRKCNVVETRRRMEQAFNSRCKELNVPIIEELVRLRHQIATLCGYPNHAAYRLKKRMAKTPANVQTFLEDLNYKLSPLADRELEVLLKYKAAEVEAKGLDEDPTVLHMYDYRYYLNQVEEKDYQVDHEALRQYFPLDAVLDGLVDIYQEVFGLRFERIDSAMVEFSTWHPEVLLFVVYRVDEDLPASASAASPASAPTTPRANETLLGYYYLDLFPREDKFGHAACWPLQAACELEGGGRRPAVTALVCNFPAPTTSKPSLLSHREVETFFHEFGHGVHNLCSMAKIPAFAGTSVERDFVEAPSQMLENWCWEIEPLKRISRHVETGESIPEDIMHALIASRNANSGLLNCRQLFFGLFDQCIHTRAEADTEALLRHYHLSVMRVPMTPETNFAASFGHMCGYDAQYYGYMWAEVFSDDMFQTRFKEDPFNSKAGRDYCDKVLAKGGSVDAADMLEAFLGRPANDEAFLRARGLDDVLSNSTLM